jgi:hypothetical protein
MSKEKKKEKDSFEDVIVSSVMGMITMGITYILQAEEDETERMAVSSSKDYAHEGKPESEDKSHKSSWEK